MSQLEKLYQKGVRTIKTNRFWNFKNQSDAVGELTIYGPISVSSWWGDEVTPKQFKSDLDALGEISELNIYINSDGGDVFAGQAIHSMLKRHSAKKTVYVDGLAASIASVIVMAGDTVIMPNNAMIMIHNPWTFAYGYSSDFRKVADDLDKIRESIIAVYEGKTALLRDEIIEMMDAETWLTAEEAKEYGFADEIEEEKQVAASIDGGFLVLNSVKMDLSKYKNKPKFMPVESKKQADEEREVPLSVYQDLIKVRKNKYKEGL